MSDGIPVSETGPLRGRSSATPSNLWNLGHLRRRFVTGAGRRGVPLRLENQHV
jgi:hypothetical protein